MVQDSNQPQTGKSKKPRIRLVNKLTLIILTLTSVWAMWLVAPSKEMLTKLISRSSSPEVSLAFLQEMYVREPENREIIQQIIDNYKKIGDLDDALKLTAEILFKEDGSKDWEAFDIYLSLLLEKSYQQGDKTASETDEELRLLLNSVGYIPEAELARKYADAAISLSMPKTGYDILLPHLHSEKTSYQELVNLALQNSDYENSLRLQLDAFREIETVDEAQKLFRLFALSDEAKLSKQFILTYSGKLCDQPEFLQLTIDHSLAIGNSITALRQSLKLLSIAPDDVLRAKTAELAISTGNINIAVSLLNDLVQNSPSQTSLSKLHDLYRWQGDLQNAYKLSRQLLAYNISEQQIRSGIEESRALGDIYYESIFYQRLVSSHQIKPSEYRNWLNALEKAQGTQSAIASINRLATTRPRDAELISHQARLYNYQGNYQQVIKKWERLTQLRKPTTDEALLSSNAFIQLHQPGPALTALTAPPEWLYADGDYLETVLSLAWDTNNRAIAKQTQYRLMQTNSDKIDVFRYLRINSPLTDKDIENLLTLYHSQGSKTALLAAIQATEKNGDRSTFIKLLDEAGRDPKLNQTPEILIYLAQEAAQNNETEKAFVFYQQALSYSPYNTAAINGILWLAINTNNQEKTADIYEEYKSSLRGNDDLWLGFATAAQQLDKLQEAEAWYQQILLNSEQAYSDTTDSKADVAVILNYASLAERMGQYDKAYKLRRYSAEKLTDELLKLEDGDISYRSLVALFAGEHLASKLAEDAALSQPNQNRTEELYLYYLANRQSDNVLFWHQRTALKNYQLPDWQKLYIAIERKDRGAMETLLTNSLNLPLADKNIALQLTGQHQKAWQHGQANLGKQTNQAVENQLRKIHVSQHPDKTHSLRTNIEQNTEWDITRYSLDYYSPHKDGNWRLGSDYQQSGTPELFVGNNIDNEKRLRGLYQYQQVETNWQLGFDFADGVGDQRLGLKASLETPLDDYWNSELTLAINDHIEASQLMTLAGQSDHIGLTLNYQPTARELLSMRFNWHELSTRFNDDIGKGWDFNLRAAEQFFFNDPAWQVYADITMQKVDLSNQPLDGVNNWNQGSTPLTSADFIEDEYQRISVGQRLWHGNPSTPGATVPSPRYWLDTSLGYNVTNSQADLAVSSGLGWRLFGNDELYLSVDWQSQDRNGDQSLKLSMGYYYSF
ncbi:hypothetical protein C942_00793 [Photobacterium marinum]|uniref:PelB C-terminal domain-containing protein n=2 Tax=Photobacterium marinum TaxID=1056511 RepID=L8JBQ9_9GAMM|nr:hypothetical protein C942_00793 [Photobacterium marinum]